jgi:phospholipase/lecithinase/hemolysin
MARLGSLLAAVAGGLALLGATIQWTREDVRVEQVFVLGDSLSDTGNAAAVADYLLGRRFYPEHEIGLCNPLDVYLFSRGCEDVIFEQSRVSDGPVAVEALVSELGLPALVPSFHTVPERPVVGTNYAVASAKARGAGPEDLAQQAEMLLLDHGPVLPEEALYVLMIGGNDAIDALRAAARSMPEVRAEAADAVVAEAVELIGAALMRLIDSGARHVLVANLPDLGIVPAVRLRAAQRGVDEAIALDQAERVAERFNLLLSERLAAIASERPAANVVSFDFRAVFEQQYALALEHGRNVGDACFDSESYRGSMLAARRFHADCAPVDGEGPRFEQFLFWDALHPTGIVHAAVGAAMARAWKGASG